MLMNVSSAGEPVGAFQLDFSFNLRRLFTFENGRSTVAVVVVVVVVSVILLPFCSFWKNCMVRTLL